MALLIVDFGDSSQGKTALLVYEWKDFDLVGRTAGNGTLGDRVRIDDTITLFRDGLLALENIEKGGV